MISEDEFELGETGQVLGGFFHKRDQKFFRSGKVRTVYAFDLKLEALYVSESCDEKITQKDPKRFGI